MGAKGLKGIGRLLTMRDPDHDYLTESLTRNMSKQQRMMMLLNGPRGTSHCDIDRNGEIYFSFR